MSIMKTPLVSVVIPAFRSGRLISESVESVTAQTISDWELIIVDNNASEETRIAIKNSMKKHPFKIRIVHEPIQGNSSARNRGIFESKGKYVALLDDDDQMLPQRLEKQLEIIERNPDSSIVHCRIDYVGFDGKTVLRSNKSNDIQEWAKILFGDHPRFPSDPPRSILPSTSLFSKKLALKLGGFDERFNPFCVEDTEFSLRMWEEGPCPEAEESLILFRTPSPEFLLMKRKNNLNLAQSLRNMNLFFSLLSEKYYRAGNKDSSRRFRKIRSQWLREIAQEVLRISDGQESAKVLLKRAISDQPMELKNWKWLFRAYLQLNEKKNTKNSDETRMDIECLISKKELENILSIKNEYVF